MFLSKRVRAFIGSALRQVWPTLLPERNLNPPDLFKTYEQACARVSKKTHHQIASQLLDLARYLFDQEESRRIGLEGTAANFLSIQGVVVPVVVAVIGLLSSQKIPVRGGLLVAITITYGASLFYIGAAFLFGLKVFLNEPRYYPDPNDLVPEEAQDGPPYELEVGRRLMEYTVKNYRVNNQQVNRLRVARVLFRNAVLALLMAGILLGMSIAWPTRPVVPQRLPGRQEWRSSSGPANKSLQGEGTRGFAVRPPLSSNS